MYGRMIRQFSVISHGRSTPHTKAVTGAGVISTNAGRVYTGQLSLAGYSYTHKISETVGGNYRPAAAGGHLTRCWRLAVSQVDDAGTTQKQAEGGLLSQPRSGHGRTAHDTSSGHGHGDGKQSLKCTSIVLVLRGRNVLARAKAQESSRDLLPYWAGRSTKASRTDSSSDRRVSAPGVANPGSTIRECQECCVKTHSDIRGCSGFRTLKRVPCILWVGTTGPAGRDSGT